MPWEPNLDEREATAAMRIAKSHEGHQHFLRLHRDMAFLRAFDELAVAYHSQGRLGTYAISWGHEAMQAGALRALDGGEWVFPSYRESAVGLLRECRSRPFSTVAGGPCRLLGS